MAESEEIQKLNSEINRLKEELILLKEERDLRVSKDDFESLKKNYLEKNEEYTYLLEKSILQNKKLLETQVKIEENQKRFQMFSDSSFEALFLSEKGKFLDANKSALEIFGFTFEEAKKLIATDIIAEEYRELVMKNYLSDYRESYEVVALKHNGEKFFAEVRGKSFDFEGREIRISAFRDISDRKKVEIELKKQNIEYLALNEEYVNQNKELYRHEKEARENKIRFETLANATIEAVILSVDGFITEFNVSALNLFEYTHQEFENILITEIISPEYRETVINNFFINNTEPYEVTCKKKSGELFYAIVKEQITEINGVQTRISTFRDITETKIAQINLEKQNLNYLKLNEEYAIKNIELHRALRKAEESELLKSAFLSNMSHEIRTPMNGIIGFIEMLKDDDITPELQKNYIDIIGKSSKQLLSIVNDILDISKIETGQVKLNLSKVNVNEIIRNLYIEFESSSTELDLHFSVFISREDLDCVIISDEQKLYQILNNLLSNAFKFTHIGGIEFGYFFSEEFLEFFVKDSGIGIDESIKDKIFEQFIQGDVSYTRSKGGTGLGLSIAKAFSELLGGNIKFESEKNSGTTFFVKIPIFNSFSDEINVIKKIEKNSNLDWSNYTFLIVEDNYTNYYFLHELLRKSKVKILYAKTGSEAILIFNENKNINLILMDVKLQDISGYDVTAAIRKINKTIPIIAQTAFAMTGDNKIALEKGCSDYISKPINKEELISKINKHLDI
jgi:PAS domain S-box-containing protein